MGISKSLGQKHWAPLLVAAAFNVAGFVALSSSTNASSHRVQEPTMIVTTFIQPKIREGTADDSLDLWRVRLQMDEPVLHIDQPSIDFEVGRNDGAKRSAPSLVGSAPSDMSPYIKRAALLPGEGATVVLRIEVLETGMAGHIEVDGSSGSRQVDEAAIEYARTLQWNAGRIDGVARATWIRWGVRLQA